MRSSAIFLVSVVTRTRSPSVTRWLICSSRSSIWPLVGLTMTSGSMRPVGRTICSTTRLECSSSHLPGRGGQEHGLAGPLHPLLEPQGPVVRGGGQAEAVVDQGLLAGPVPLVLAVQLGDGHVGLVDDGEVVVGEEVQQRVGRLARAAAVDGRRVVLDAVAEAHLLQHLQVVLGAHAQPLGLQQLALASRTVARRSCSSVSMRPMAGLQALVARSRSGWLGEDDELVEAVQLLAGERVDHADASRPRRRTARCGRRSPRRRGGPRACRPGPGTCPG